MKRPKPTIPGAQLRKGPYRSLSRRARRYVLVVDVAAVACLIGLVWTAPASAWRPRDVLTAGAFVACGVLSVEVFKRVGAPYRRVDRPFNDLTAAFLVPVVLLLPPVWSALVALPLNVLFQMRVTRLAPHKWAFNTAVTILVCVAGAWAHLSLAAPLDQHPLQRAFATPRPVLALFLAIAVYLAVNKALVVGVIRRAAPGTPWRALLCDREAWTLALGDVSAGIVLTLVWMASPVLIVFALVPILLLQRAVVHSHLVMASRHDNKTGLANPSWWRQESGRAVTRARHGGERVAVLVIDLDRFKTVNDRHGHLVGDAILAAVADTIRVVVRPGDLVGRFGGDEFTVLLTSVDETQAVSTAGRLRERIAATLMQSVPSPDPHVGVTASVGVAVFGRDGVDLDDLLSAADGAMYRAKALGGDAVCLAEMAASPQTDSPQTQRI